MSRRARKTPPPGIEERHRRGCATSVGGACTCEPHYRAWISNPGERRKLQRTFPTLAAAVLWREDAKVDLRRGALTPQKSPRLDEAADLWLEGARSGAILNRSGDRYKPSALRGYAQALRDYVLPALGNHRLAELRRGDVQRIVDELVADGLSSSTVRNALLALRAICRRALIRGEIAVNPTQGLELPAQRGRRDRIASPAEAAALLAVLPAADRALWATAMYAGLRLGELQALRWEDVFLDERIIKVRRSWDRRDGDVAPRSRAGVRSIPIAALLHAELERHRETSWVQTLVFGRASDLPFSASGVVYRAHRLWKKAGLDPIGPHECRHTFASFMIAAGVNPKALQTFMGHSSITITLDLYGHLMPGSEDEAAALLDAYLSPDPGDQP